MNFYKKVKLIIICLLMPVSFLNAKPLGERLAVESRLPVYLNNDEAIMVFERKDASDRIAVELSFLEQNTGNIPTEPMIVRLSSPTKRYEHKIDISSWQDGEYKVFIKEAGADSEQALVRGLFKQTLQAPVAPTGIIDMTGIKMLFVDDWYIERESGVKRVVHPAELIPINPWQDNEEYFYFRNSLRKQWFDIDGNLIVQISAANMLADEPIEYWAKSSDMKSWEIIDKPTDMHTDCDIQNMKKAARNVAIKNIRYYDAAKDGEINLSEVQVLYTGLQRGVKWGDIEMPHRSRVAVWDTSEGERLIIGEPVTSDKSIFNDDEIGTWKDSNDNFGGIHFSPDGKTLRCYQSRLIPRREPFRVHYDNILCDRMMITWSTQDGLNWKPTFFDAPTLEDPWSTQHYGVDVWSEENKRLEMAYHKIYDVQYQRLYTELAYSRDGLYWNRFEDAKPFLDNSSEVDDWNFGYSIITDTARNRTRMSYGDYYYEPMTGINVLHFMFLQANNRDRSLLTEEFYRSRFGGRLLGDNGFQNSPIMNWYGTVENVIEQSKKQMFTPGLMKYRKDGWVSASSTKRRGVIETKTFKANGELLINAKTAADGFVLVEVLDRAGNAIDRYSGNNGAVFSGDDVAQPLSWAEGMVSSLPSQPFKLRITLENAEVYTLKFK